MKAGKCRWWWVGVSAAAIGSIMMVACGGGEDDAGQAGVSLEEHDGAELVALMEGAREAIRADDFRRYQTLFGGSPDAKTYWDAISRLKERSGGYHVERLTACPGVERAEPEIHVSRLVLTEWFDLSRETGRRSDVYQTTWKFARADTAWRLDNMRIDRANTTYHELLRDMQQMSYPEYLTLGMDWEEFVDPLPLMRRWLEAASEMDFDALESRMVAGVYPRAFDMNIDLPTLASDDDWAGESNRESSEKMMEETTAALQKSAEKLRLKPMDLAPFFGAYRVTSMPDNCTKLRFDIKYGGEEVPAKKVEDFSVEWSAAYINSRWLIEDMLVKSITTTF